VLELGLPKNTVSELLIGGVRVCSALPVGKGDRVGVLLQEDAGWIPQAAESEHSEAAV